MKFEVGLKTDVGLRRSQNQDALAAHPDLGLFIVADGMGGHMGGEVASKLSVKTISSVFSDLAKYAKSVDAKRALYQAFDEANRVINGVAATQKILEGMGTTTVVLHVRDDHILVGNVGDSRCYLIRSNAIWQLTKDHSVVAEKVRAGLMSTEAARTSEQKNVITRSVGYDLHVLADSFEIEPMPDDIFLLCTDGLSSLVDDSTILRVIRDNLIEQHDPQSAADALVSKANESGGLDNISVLLVRLVNA